MQNIPWESTIVKLIDIEKARKIPDMHIHSRWCNHAKNEIADVVEYLSTNGIWGAFNEHAPLPRRFLLGEGKFGAKIDIDLGDDDLDMVSYFRRCDLHESQEGGFVDELVHYGGSIPVGLEVDILEGFEDDTEDVILRMKEALDDNRIGLNHVSGSVHHLEGYTLFRKAVTNEYMKVRSPEGIIKKYFETLCDAAESKRYDFLCHQGLIHFAINLALGRSMMQDDALRKAYYMGFRHLMDSCVASDTCLEINTSGIDRPYKSMSADYLNGFDDYIVECSHPHIQADLLKEANGLGVKFVVGSDWHVPGQEQRYFDKVYDGLTDMGINTVYKIVDREPIPVRLE